MESTMTSNRIHPLMAAAATSLTLVCLVGAAAIAGILPSSHSAAAASPAIDGANGGVLVAQQPMPEPAAKPVVQYKTIVHHEYPRYRENANNSARTQVAQAESTRQYSQAPSDQQAAPVAAAAQNSPIGIGLGALVGGLVGSQVGSGNGRTLAAIAGAVGGGYVGNEIAKRNQ
ncbi:MAG: glycine zipper 2TM domain-containing protein [Pseudomonadota bacterium]